MAAAAAEDSTGLGGSVCCCVPGAGVAAPGPAGWVFIGGGMGIVLAVLAALVAAGLGALVVFLFSLLLVFELLPAAPDFALLLALVPLVVAVLPAPTAADPALDTGC
jgi:hypothetical protein